MPFLGLIISSCAFLIPTVLAYRKKKYIMARTCGILTLTSVLYHGTQHLFFKTIDIFYAHGVAVVYTWTSIKKYVKYRRLYDIFILSGVGTSIYIFYDKSCNKDEPYQDHWHMVMHFISQGAWILHALDSKI